ncbi:MAG: redoxin family protein, partial [Candidatus Liptonbacteria bacterium]|nr:redoxin family protein [Candidatus Liptonbacteria bacterium]
MMVLTSSTTRPRFFMNAPEFPKDLIWLNSKPIQMADLRGKAVVLIDFWTYSCVNCIRSMPYLKEWHERYKDKGLVIVGVHTPEFAFEKEKDNVLKAVKDFGITYPVVMDNDYAIWQLYANRFWPRKYLVSSDGQIAYDHTGEGGYTETEEEIQKALLELNPKLSF